MLATALAVLCDTRSRYGASDSKSRLAYALRGFFFCFFFCMNSDVLRPILRTVTHLFHGNSAEVVYTQVTDRSYFKLRPIKSRVVHFW